MLSIIHLPPHASRPALMGAVLMGLTLCDQALALKSDSSEPISISSDEQLADLQNNKAVFTGHVRASQGSIEVSADKAEIMRDAHNQLKEVHAYGKPVTFRQKLDNGKLIRTQSSQVQYLPQQRLVVLQGNVTVWQDDSHISGERIEYNLDTQRLKASNHNSQGGRVQSTFIPSQLK
ncbi:MAG: lipopolysaccharide transport periplasmic protein LptA [Succinivibrio sp.]|nr:lipopolysaccharide transport periplasmic protein LptA [Succinivibrio sp.]